KICSAALAITIAIFSAFSLLAGVGLGWLSALAGSIKIINWLTLPTAAANLITVFGNYFTTVQFAAVVKVTRAIGAIAMAVLLIILWWRHRRNDRDAMTGIVLSMLTVVLLSPAALPWYYSWPLAIGAGLITKTTPLAWLVWLSVWLMVVFKPDGAHGLYSWPHVIIASAIALAATKLFYSCSSQLHYQPAQRNSH
ncbi:MAG: alpha-(1-_6)-mannopyranosyltransferase A, partial [Mycobacteriaceae bacterium]